MLQHKRVRQRGKLSLSRFFQKFEPGEQVAIVRELGLVFGYSKRTQGRTGKVIKKRGSAYEVLVNDLNSPKTYFIKPIHLKKIEGAVAK